MSDHIKNATAPAWEGEPLAGRMQKCITMLYVHGLIPSAEMLKARKRLEKELS